MNVNSERRVGDGLFHTDGSQEASTNTSAVVPIVFPPEAFAKALPPRLAHEHFRLSVGVVEQQVGRES